MVSYIAGSRGKGSICATLPHNDKGAASSHRRYLDGFDANCRLAENVTVVQGDAADPLMAAAARQTDGDPCAQPQAQAGAQTSERAAPLAQGRGDRLRRVRALDEAQGTVAR